MAKCLALDIGERRIGLATCDRLEVAATPHSVVKTGKQAIDTIVALLDEEQIELIVVGLPISLDGKERGNCEQVRRFIQQLSVRTECPITTYDERLTTKIAEQSLIAAGKRREQRREMRDAVAAAVILQGFLAQRHNTMHNPA